MKEYSRCVPLADVSPAKNAASVSGAALQSCLTDGKGSCKPGCSFPYTVFPDILTPKICLQRGPSDVFRQLYYLHIVHRQLTCLKKLKVKL